MPSTSGFSTGRMVRWMRLYSVTWSVDAKGSRNEVKPHVLVYFESNAHSHAPKASTTAACLRCGGGGAP